MNNPRTERWQAKRRAEMELLEKIPCACGCGTMICPETLTRKPVQYAKGHWRNGRKMNKPAWNREGEKPLTPSERTKRTWEKRWSEIEQMPKISCACGCGEMIYPFTRNLKPAKYKQGHNPAPRHTLFEKGHVTWNKDIPSELQPAWRGGVGVLPYGKEFTRKFKRLIRQRDQYTCQRCGITQADYGRTLQIHHVNHDKMDNSLGNLVCACGKCNIWANYHRNEPFINPEVWERTHPT